MSRPYISHDEATAKSFRNDPSFAAEYLNSVLENGDQQEIMVALRRLADAAGLNSNTLYRTLSPAGNPQLRSLQSILGAMGMRLAVTPVAQQ